MTDYVTFNASIIVYETDYETTDLIYYFIATPVMITLESLRAPQREALFSTEHIFGSIHLCFC